MHFVVEALTVCWNKLDHELLRRGEQYGMSIMQKYRVHTLESVLIAARAEPELESTL